MKYTIEITSPPDRENFVAEIWEGDIMIAELNQESENLVIEVYCRKGKPMLLDFKEFLSTMEEAKCKLVG